MFPKGVILFIRELNTSRRNCYFNKERYLRFYKTYTPHNCQLECLSNYTVAKCGCGSYSLPRGQDTPLCAYNQVECYTEARREFFGGDQSENSNNYENEESAEIQMLKKGCDCLPSCISITYEMHSSETEEDPEKYEDWFNGFLFHIDRN